MLFNVLATLAFISGSRGTEVEPDLDFERLSGRIRYCKGRKWTLIQKLLPRAVASGLVASRAPKLLDKESMAGCSVILYAI